MSTNGSNSDRIKNVLMCNNNLRVTSRVGAPLDPKAEYYVLRLDNNIPAQKALYEYAILLASEDSDCADDLLRFLERFRHNIKF